MLGWEVAMSKKSKTFLPPAIIFLSNILNTSSILLVVIQALAFEK